MSIIVIEKVAFLLWFTRTCPIHKWPVAPLLRCHRQPRKDVLEHMLAAIRDLLASLQGMRIDLTDADALALNRENLIQAIIDPLLGAHTCAMGCGS